jgi:hypothetical protein
MNTLRRRFIPVLCLALLTAMIAPMTQAADAKTGAYRHVVFFKFKDSASPEQIKKIEDEFRKLPSKMDFITGFEYQPGESERGFHTLLPRHLQRQSGRGGLSATPRAQGLRGHLEAASRQGLRG